jgi:hypothetical protein
MAISWKLRWVPTEERCFLDFFFRRLVSTNSGCYVLFGDKPASLMGYQEGLTGEVFAPHSLRWTRNFYPERRGFEIWEKYKFLFPFKSYEIIKVRSHSVENWSVVLLIQKQRTLEVISRHFDLFQGVFPQYLSPEDLFNAMLKDPSILGEICFKHDLLLGILLGFGKGSASLFAREQEILNFLSPTRKNQSFAAQSLYPLLPSSEFSSLQQELEAICQKGGSIIDPEDENIEWALHLPLGFLVDTEEEDLERLRKTFKQQRITATRAYKNGDYLETSLRELAR